MKLTHTFRHLDRSQALVQYAFERVQEAARFLLKSGHGHVQYSKVQHEFLVEVTVNTREKFFKAEAQNPDPYAAVDEAVDRLERQFLKVKRSVKNHKRPELSRKGHLSRLNKRFEYQPRFKKAA